jgi:metallo-beta-lactamase class B
MKTVFILISMLFPVAVMAQKSVKISDDISITQLSDKVYTYVSLAEIEGWGMVPSNGMIVINNYQAALLDTPINDAQTETLVNWVADSLHAKVTTFIPNHWHGDCIGGLGYLQKKGVQSYANQMTIDLAKEKYGCRIDPCLSMQQHRQHASRNQWDQCGPAEHQATGSKGKSHT